MYRLVEQHLPAPDRQLRGEPEAVVSDVAREVHALGAELGNCLLDVVAHQRDLVVLVRRPVLKISHPSASTLRSAEHVPEERPRRLGAVGADQRVHGGVCTAVFTRQTVDGPALVERRLPRSALERGLRVSVRRVGRANFARAGRPGNAGWRSLVAPARTEPNARASHHEEAR